MATQYPKENTALGLFYSTRCEKRCESRKAVTIGKTAQERSKRMLSYTIDLLS